MEVGAQLRKACNRMKRKVLGSLSIFLSIHIHKHAGVRDAPQQRCGDRFRHGPCKA